MNQRHGPWISLATTVLGAAFFSLIYGEQISAQLSAPTSVVTNREHAVLVNGSYDVDIENCLDHNLPLSLLEIATNGIIVNDHWDTWPDGNRIDNAGRVYGQLTDFAGLYYGISSRFDTIDVTIHNFGDGGDWEAQPKLYILKVNYDTGGARPELHPYWEEVTGFTEMTGHVFNPIATGPAEQTMSFDLTGIPALNRTGYGWALGGVDGTVLTGTNLYNFIAISELYATGQSGLAAPAAPSIAPLTAVNVMSNIYNAPHIDYLYHGYNNRGASWQIATNGVISSNATARADDFVDMFDTCCDTNGEVTDFAGLYYGAPHQFDTITVDTYATGTHNDGGTWEEEPKLYILRVNYDTNMTRPEVHPYWEEVTGATVTRNPDGYDIYSTPGGVRITFDLSGVPAAQRRGYAWAVGGADGTQANPGPHQNFIHITELQATGSAVSPADVPSLPKPSGTNLVSINVLSNNYSLTRISGVNHESSRGAAYEIATNGIIESTPDQDEWETTPQRYDDSIPIGDTSDATDFAGLYYCHASIFDTVTAHTYSSDLAPAGGEWSAEPKLYLLKNDVDTNQTRPEEDTVNWQEVTGAVLTYDGILEEYCYSNGYNFFSFDLTGLSTETRTGYGWAIGGVNGTKTYNGIGNFIAITELEATGTVIELAPTENADFNGDNIVDGSDFLIWQVGLGMTGQTNNSNGDADGDGVVNGADLAIWKTQFGAAPPPGTAAAAIPEPATGLLFVVMAIGLAALRRRGTA